MSNLSDRPPLPPGGAAPDKPAGNPYSRFIPREELSSFSAWQPGAFGPADAGGKGGGKRSAAAPEPAPPPPPPSPQQQLKAARDAGYKDGYRDGLAALEQFKQSHSQQVGAQVAAVVQSLHQQFDALEKVLAQRVAGVALALARQVVRDELVSRPEHVVAVAQEALAAMLVTARHVTLRLHPDDQALVAAGAAEMLAARGVRLVPDPRIARGGCIVDADIGQVDAQVATRWQRAAATLGHDSAWTADEAPATGPAEVLS